MSRFQLSHLWTRRAANGNTRGKLPRIVRFLLINCLIGSALGAAFAALLMFSNVAGLTDLIATSEQPLLPAAMLVFGCALTFGSATMAAAVMSLESDE